MTPKMVSNFRRSLSFPNHPNNPPKDSKTYHVRSTSLPSRSHPLIFQLKDHLNQLKSWGKSRPDTRTSAWLCDGLTRLKTVHDYLDDVLHLRQSLESLRRQPELIERLLEDFLRFVDVYGIFQTLVLALKQEHSAAQVAIRRKSDDSKIESYVKSLRKLGKEMGKLVSTVRCTRSFSNIISNVEAELAKAILDVQEVTVLVSTALFNGILLPIVSKKSAWMGMILGKKGRVEEEGIVEFQEVGTERLLGLRKKGDEEMRMVLKKMIQLEGCVSEIEMGSERVFRSLINTRVSLLNVLTK